MWALLAGVWSIAALLLIWVLEAPMVDDWNAACPEDSAPVAGALSDMLSDAGDVTRLDLTNPTAIEVTVDLAGDSRLSPIDLRKHMGQLMRGFYQVARCYPIAGVIHADLETSGGFRYDQHGTRFAGYEVPMMALAIDTEDLRAFRPDFDWESYPVFAANRYMRWINISVKDAWRGELQKEEQLGNFVASL